jgi:tRNA threonylcarbamoyladenosine biosynthesis protein TsaE
MCRLVLNSVEETRALGEALGAGAIQGCVIALIGALGAGKTAFTQGFARALGVVGAVTSPTFVLAALHETGRLRLHHVDFYRLRDEEDLLSTGLLEGIGRDGAFLVEWADRFPELLPDDRLEVVLAFIPGQEDAREAGIRALGPAHRALEMIALDPSSRRG